MAYCQGTKLEQEMKRRKGKYVIHKGSTEQTHYSLEKQAEETKTK